MNGKKISTLAILGLLTFFSGALSPKLVQAKQTVINQNASAPKEVARSCRAYIRRGTVLTWTTYDGNSFHNSGTIRVTAVNGNRWSGIQYNGSIEEDVLGEISDSSFTLRNPRWSEVWVGECDSSDISGNIRRSSDSQRFSFSIRVLRHSTSSSNSTYSILNDMLQEALDAMDDSF